MNILREIKWAWQRVVKGYDDRIYWEFDSYLSWMMIPALKIFCEEKLADKEHCKWNPIKEGIYQEMLRLISDFQEMDYQDQFKDENAESKMYEYFGKFISYFWN